MTKATEVTQSAEVTDDNKVAMSGKEMVMFILNKSIDTAMKFEKSAPTLQSADEPSLIDNQQRANKFSIDVLHPRLQNIIKETNSSLGFPTDYLAGAMLTAMAAAIGNTHAVEHMQGWREYVILFVALVGSPG
ncbi:MAG: YfjI family protein [Clostridium sp.]|nr:YfjI family protein [Clostridium sp.]